MTHEFANMIGPHRKQVIKSTGDALRALAAHAKVTPEAFENIAQEEMDRSVEGDGYDTITDILCNIMHFCEEWDYDFGFHLAQAEKHYMEEREAAIAEDHARAQGRTA